MKRYLGNSCNSNILNHILFPWKFSSTASSLFKLTMLYLPWKLACKCPSLWQSSCTGPSAAEGAAPQQLWGNHWSSFTLQPLTALAHGRKDLFIRQDDRHWVTSCHCFGKKKKKAILLGRGKVPLINRENRMEEGSWASKWKQLAQEEITSLSTFCEALHRCSCPPELLHISTV